MADPRRSAGYGVTVNSGSCRTAWPSAPISWKAGVQSPGTWPYGLHPVPEGARVSSEKPVVRCWRHRDYWCKSALLYRLADCGVRTAHRGLLMFHAQRLSVRLASHVAGQQRARELAAVTAYRRDTGPDIVTPDVRGTYGPAGPAVESAPRAVQREPPVRSRPARRRDGAPAPPDPGNRPARHP